MTVYTTLISAPELAALRDSGAPVLIIDVSFELDKPAAGRQAFESSHIPGAVYLDLEHDLSSAKTGRNGRHPLPDREAFARTMAQAGLNTGTPVVVYDRTGAMFAARLWWMLRWCGHAPVAVLDGGLAAWTEAGQPVAQGPTALHAVGDFSAGAPLVSTLNYRELAAQLPGGSRLLIDARAPDRFAGQNETLDPVAGHIPGARNRFFRHNLDASGRFRAAAELRQDFDTLLQGRPVTELVSQCGSGVTACHNLLALEVAGLPGAALYPGSWSEWCAQPGAPTATA